jgi:hypothetical protein
MKRSARERRRLPARRGERLPDVILRGPGWIAVPDRQGQGGRAIPHRPVPARAAPGEGAQRPGPAAAQAGLGLGRATPARPRPARPRPGTCGWVRPRLHYPPVAGHPDGRKTEGGHPVRASGRLGSAGDNVGDAGTGARTKEDPMSDLQAIADRVEIEALRGEFTDAVMMHDYDRLASLFTQDGTVRLPHAYAGAVGREDMRAGGEQLQALLDYIRTAGSSPSVSTRSDTSTTPRSRARHPIRQGTPPAHRHASGAAALPAPVRRPRQRSRPVSRTTRPPRGAREIVRAANGRRAAGCRPESRQRTGFR